MRMSAFAASLREGESLPEAAAGAAPPGGIGGGAGTGVGGGGIRCLIMRSSLIVKVGQRPTRYVGHLGDDDEFSGGSVRVVQSRVSQRPESLGMRSSEW